MLFSTIKNQLFMTNTLSHTKCDNNNMTKFIKNILFKTGTAPHNKQKNKIRGFLKIFFFSST